MSLNLNGRKVESLRLHQTSQAKGFGTITTPLQAVSQGRGIKALEMVICDKGVYCKGKGPQGEYEFLIPMHNVISMDLQEEPAEKPKEAPKK